MAKLLKPKTKRPAPPSATTPSPAAAIAKTAKAATKSKAKPEPKPSPEAAAPAASGLPLFYVQPRMLTAAAFGDLRLKTTPDYRFAAKSNAVPLMAGEFAEAARFYPIVFAGEGAAPAVILGLESVNVLADAAGGWAAGAYIPAYIRRYPFIFITQPSDGALVLGIDTACERLTRAEGPEPSEPLFADGQPSALTREAVRFAGAFQAEHASTGAFTAALRDHGLLIDNQATGAFPDGRPIHLQGFQIVDEAKFRALEPETAATWREKGWDILVAHHLASLGRWSNLLR